MPNYDYKCLECSHTFEVFQKMSEKPLDKCPKCGGKVKRLIGPGAGPIFRGKGFYQTDYKNSGNSSSEKSKPRTCRHSRSCLSLQGLLSRIFP